MALSDAENGRLGENRLGSGEKELSLAVENTTGACDGA